SATELRARGGGASQFSINVGDPKSSISQFDVSFYGQDDWRLKPNLTVSYGLRYEYQNNTHSPLNFGPRLAVAWSPGAANSARPPKMVIRFGTGFFYNRFNEGRTLQANRFNGVNVLQTSVVEPIDRNTPPNVAEQALPNVAGIYSILNQWSPTTIPSVAGIPLTQQTIWQVDPNLQNPTVFVVGTQLERQ